MYIEVVPGLGETLVGGSAGSAFRCLVKKSRMPKQLTSISDSNDWLTIEAFPSKAIALRPSCSQAERLIFRSDSNAEDLKG